MPVMQWKQPACMCALELQETLLTECINTHMQLLTPCENITAQVQYVKLFTFTEQCLLSSSPRFQSFLEPPGKKIKKQTSNQCP